MSSLNRAEFADSLSPAGCGMTVSPSINIRDFLPQEPIVYLRAYKYLCKQHDRLIEIERRINFLAINCQKNDKNALDYFIFLVQSFLRCDFGTIFFAISNSIESIRETIHKSHLSHSVSNIGYDIITTSLALARLETFVLVQSTTSHPTAPPERHISPIFSDPMQILVLCRICEQYVPLSMIEEHSTSCAQAYQARVAMVSTNDRISRLIDAIKKVVLCHPWPGEEDRVISTSMPVIHAVLLLQKAFQVNTQSPDSGEELQLILSAMGSITVISDDSNAHDLLKRALNLIEEKLRACTTFSEAKIIQEKTRVSVGVKKRAGTTIAEFEIVKRISSGAYARVFLAKKKTTGDIYAVKVTPKSSLKQKNQVRRVIAEKDILLQFSNPYIVNFFYSIIGYNNLYLVMEYLPGGDLFSLLQKVGALDEFSAKVYTAQIVCALNYLHSHGIIHRDLKPDNILVTKDGHLKLTDFGLSYVGVVDRGVSLDRFGNFKQDLNMNSNEKIIESDSLVGTPDYLAPEVIMSQPHSFTVDYWSLGAMIYEFLYGIPPFHADSENGIFTNILKGEIDFDDDNIEISEEAKSLIQGLLTVKTENRLGFNGIKEIENHPWFKGIDWNNVDQLEPPFVPDISNRLSTEYFEERYKLSNDNESDIIEDIEEALQQNEQQIPESPSLSSRVSVENTLNSQPSMEDSDDDDIMHDFPAISVQQLRQTNEQIAKKLRNKRSCSFVVGGDDESDLFGTASMSQILNMQKQLEQHDKTLPPPEIPKNHAGSPTGMTRSLSADS